MRCMDSKRRSSETARRGRVVGAALLLCLAAAAGCAHPCGYVTLRAERTPLEGERTVELIPSGQPLRIELDLSVSNSVLVVRVEQREVASGPVRRRLYGRPTIVPWRWYAPIVKPLVSATLVLPLYFSWYDPHIHGHANWRMSDYLRDVGSWFNWFSAVPIDSRRIEDREVLLSVAETTAPVSERMAGIEGRTVELHLDGSKAAERVADADGRVRFDVSRFLTAEFVKDNRKIKIVSPDPEAKGEPAETEWTLDRYLLRELFRKRTSGD